MANLNHFILALLITFTLSQNLFNTSPVSIISLQTTNANIIKMAAGETYMFIGFNNGTLAALNINGGIRNVFPTGNSFSIIQIDSFPNLVMALDSGSNLYVWIYSGNGTMVLSQSLTSTVSNVAWKQTSNLTLIVSVNYGNNITEYQFSSGTLSATGNVYSFPGATFTTAKYSGDGNWLVAGTNTSQVRLFNTSSGVVSNSFLSTTSPINKFSLLNNNQNMVALTNNYQMYWINTGDFTYVNLTTIRPTSAFSGCPSSLIVSGSVSNSLINVYLQNGNFLQGLNYSRNTVASLDCSPNYLVSLDVSGNVAVNTYSYVSLSTLRAWVIAIIVVGAVLCCGGIGLLIWCCCRKRKLAPQVNLNTTGKELMVQDNISYKHQMY